jgi:predicted lipoprotein with Yx(FWY)xxD motif
LTVSAGTSATAGAGLTGTIGTISRPDGTTQVTYNGWPLYRYSKDAKAGDATGQGVGGIWYAMTATTAAAGPTSATTGPTTTAYSGY